jgi:hypothetical protein
MRNQEKIKLQQLAEEHDLDPQAFDYDSASYDVIKEQILKLAGATAKEDLMWTAQEHWYNAQEIAQKVYIPEDVASTEMKNCLVLSFSARHYGFAVKMLLAEHPNTFMHKTNRIIANNKKLSPGNKVRILWFFGSKKTTNKILQDLREKHNVHPQVLRDSYLRRDDLHYANGELLSMKKKDFVAVS